MEPLSVRLCLLSLTQVTLVYAKIENGLLSVPYVVLLFPLFLYFLGNVWTVLVYLYTAACLTPAQAGKAVLGLFTQVSFFLSAYFYAEMLDYDLTSYTPAAIPFVLAIGCNLVCGLYESVHHSHLWAVGINLVTPALSTCSTTGICSSLYASTLTSFLSTFGISVLDISQCLWPVTALLLAISLYSLYYTHRSVCYAPFLLGAIAGVGVLLSQTLVDCWLLTWSSNALLIGAAVWNNHLAKSSDLLPHKLI